MKDTEVRWTEQLEEYVEFLAEEKDKNEETTKQTMGEN